MAKVVMKLTATGDEDVVEERFFDTVEEAKKCINKYRADYGFVIVLYEEAGGNVELKIIDDDGKEVEVS
mgnify:CR=1 FL=1